VNARAWQRARRAVARSVTQWTQVEPVTSVWRRASVLWRVPGVFGVARFIMSGRMSKR
jgi:hypothetical protein